VKEVPASHRSGRDATSIARGDKLSACHRVHGTPLAGIPEMPALDRTGKEQRVSFDQGEQSGIE